MHPLCIRASDHSFLLRRVLFHPSQLRFTNNSNGNTMEVLPSWQILFTLGSAVANFVRDHDLFEIHLLCFSWFCCFLLGGNFGHILFDLVAFIQWTDLRDQPITAFLMKGCFVDSIDIDGFDWIRITDQISQHKSSNDKKKEDY